MTTMHVVVGELVPKTLAVRKAEIPLTEEELELILTDSHEKGVLTEGEARIMIRAIEFADKDAEEILIAPDRDDQRTLGIVTLEDVRESLVGDVREAPRGQRAP
jgi:CBS domain containing-hemolysin-like protein